MNFKNIISNLVFLAILGLFIWGIGFVPSLTQWWHKSEQINPLIYTITNVLQALVMVFGFIGLSYNKIWKKESLVRTWPKITFFTSLVVVFCLGILLCNFYRNHQALYDFCKKNQARFDLKVFGNDPELGLVPLPNVKGNYHSANFIKNKEIHTQVPIFTDNQRFRVISDTTTTPEKVDLAFFGCSWTWGDYIKANESYSYVCANNLHKTYLNAGRSGYGLAQMLILAKRIIPKYKPKHVVVQYAHWLPGRQMQFPSFQFQGPIMVPYFTEKPIDQMTVEPPLFLTSLVDVPFAKYQTTKTNLWDELNFMREVSFDLLLKDELKLLWAKAKMKLRLVAKGPNTNWEQTEAYFYDQMHQLCEANGAKMIVIGLDDLENDNSAHPRYNHERFLKTVNKSWAASVPFIDSDSILRSHLRPKEQMNKYQIWIHNNGDSTVLDTHPGPLANRYFAEAIEKTLDAGR